MRSQATRIAVCVAALSLSPSLKRFCGAENVDGPAIRGSATAAERTDALFAAWRKPDSPGCVVAVIQNGRVIYEHGYGMANLEYEIPNAPSTVFQVASMSKQFTAFAIHLLAREGKLSLDDDVRKYLPELHDFGKTITVRHLLHHTSGLRDQSDLLNLSGYRPSDVVREQDVLNLIWRQRRLNFEPGTNFLYCNSGYTLLAVIVKRVSGDSLREFARKRLFDPLGMTHTEFHDDFETLVKNRADSYQPKPGGGYERSVFSSSDVGASGLLTTVDDLALWDANFYDGRVGGKELIAEMQRKGKLNDGREVDYASGLAIGMYRGLKTVEHNGLAAGYRSDILRFPEQGFSVIVLANSVNLNAATLAHRVAGIYLQDELAPEAVRTPTEPTTKLAQVTMAPGLLHDYVGEFYSEELGALCAVSVEGGGLMFKYPRGEMSLKPVSGDTFAPVSDQYPVVGFQFMRGPTGMLTGFEITTQRSWHMGFEKIRIEPVANSGAGSAGEK